MKNIQVFSDFDGTITKEDTLNKFLQEYADENWLEIENDWIKGKIGSKECMEKQMKLFTNITNKTLQNFLDSIEIDETFVDFYKFLKSESIDFFVVSDGFDLFIDKIFNHYGLQDIKVFSNNLKFENNVFYTAFPYTNPNCERKSGVCKCNVLKNNRIVTNRVIYAGDGLSDYCVSQKADIVFAKGSLLEYCKTTKNNNFHPFKKFSEIENYIKML